MFITQHFKKLPLYSLYLLLGQNGNCILCAMVYSHLGWAHLELEENMCLHVATQGILASLVRTMPPSSWFCFQKLDQIYPLFIYKETKFG